MDKAFSLPILAVGGVLGSAFLLYTVYIAYVHRKYSHIPSPKRPNFFSGHNADLTRSQKEESKEDAFFWVVEYWLSGMDPDTSTFVVFIFHLPMIITVDPIFMKALIVNQKNDKTMIYPTTFSSIFGIRFMMKALFAIQSYETSNPIRKLYMPGFDYEYLLSIIHGVPRALDPTLEKMRALADGRTQVPMTRYIKRLTLEATSQAIFSTSFSSLWNADSLGIKIPSGSDTDVMSYVVKVCMEGLQINSTSLVPSLNRLLYPCQAGKFRSCTTALRTMGKDCLVKRREMVKNNETLPTDCLSKMLQTNIEKLDMEQFQDQFCNIFALGYDPLSNALLLTFILLHQNPNALEGIYEEIEDVLGRKSEITAEDLDRMKYTEKVFYEAIRLYYVAPGTTRNTYEDTKAGKYSIPANSLVLVADSNVYRMGKYFKDPDCYKPDRFENEPAPSIEFSPFGVGARRCLGGRLCMMIAKIVLARLVQNFTFDFPRDYKIVIARDPAVRPKDDFVCTLRMKC